MHKAKCKNNLLCKISIVLIGKDLIIHNLLPSKEINPALIIFNELVPITAIQSKATIYSSIIFLYCKGITASKSTTSTPLTNNIPAINTVNATPKAAFNIIIGFEVKCFNSRLNKAIF